MRSKKKIRKGKKEEIETKIFFGVLLFSLLIIAGILVFSNWKMAQKRKTLTERINTLRGEVETLQKRNEQLKEGITESQDEDFWEARIREQGYKKPGETAVVVKKEEGGQEEMEPPKNVWEKFIAGIKFWEK